VYGIINVFDFGDLFEAYMRCTNYEDFFNSELQTASRLEGEVLLRIRQVSSAYRWGSDVVALGRSLT